MSIPPILCVVGRSGSGKTSLLERVVRVLVSDGLKVGVVKHAGGALQIGPAGKDSSRLAAVGAVPAIAAGPDDLIVQGATRPTSLLDLAASFCAGSDLVLTEGYKHSPHDKILVVGGDEDKSDRHLPAVKLIVGEASGGPRDTVDRADTAGVAAWIKQWLDRRHRLTDGVVGAVLVGGQSRRMGADKAAMRFGGRGVLANLTELLGGWLGEVWVVGRSTGVAGVPRCVRWHRDICPGRGPLGGIATALRLAGCSGAKAVLVVACDMPALAAKAVELLLANRRADAPASALRRPPAQCAEPLAAVYEPTALEQIEQAIEAGELSATQMLKSLGACEIEVPPEIAGELLNVNRPEDIETIQREQ